MIPLLLVLLAATPISLPSANQEWTRVTTPRFTIVSAAGERNTREMARDLETLAAALVEFLGAEAPSPIRTGGPPVLQTRVIVFARRGEAQPYLDLLLNRDHSNATGVFVLQRGAATMLIDVSLGRGTTGIPADVAPRAHFHRGANDMDSIVYRYMSPQFSMLLRVSPPPDVNVGVAKITHADFIFELGRLLATLDRAAPDADRHFRAVLDEHPDHAGALAGLARLRSREAKDEESWALFERAIASDPHDATVQLMF